MIRPRPLEEKTAWLEAKFDGLVDWAVASKPFYPKFEMAIAGTVTMAEKIGTMAMCRKRCRKPLLRLPSEVWHLILTEFGGWDPQTHQQYVCAPSKPLLTAAEVWDLYTTETELYAQRVCEATESRDIMKRFIKIM
jgi:hypothetical protein